MHSSAHPAGAGAPSRAALALYRGPAGATPAPDARPLLHQQTAELAQSAARHLALDRDALLGDLAIPHVNAAVGMGLARLVDEGEPLAQAEDRLRLAHTRFRQRMEELP